MAKARTLGYQKTGSPNAKAAPPYWQVKRGSDCLSYGPRETFPGAGERKKLREGGHRILVEGRTWKDGQA